MDEKIIETVDAEVDDTEQTVESSLQETLFKAALVGGAVIATGGLAYLGYKLYQKKTNPELYYAKKAERLEKKSEKAKAKFEKAWDQWKAVETVNEQNIQEDIYEEVEENVED